VHKVIETVAQKMGLPEWWVEAVAIEYTDCREFATRDEIWTFNFDRVSQKSLEEAVRSHHIVVYGIIWQNVHADVFGQRAIERLVSDIPVPLVKEPSDAMAEGAISDYHFSFLSNPIDVWDPKLSFSSHFQVLDEGQLWQWRIAKFVSIEGRKYGKWISSEVDLEPLDQIHERLASLRNPVIKPDELGHADFKLKVENFYQWLDQIRQPILRALEDVHHAKRSGQASLSKVTKGVPPLLSRFEMFTVQNSKICTRFLAAPVFFRAARQHALHAEELAASAHSDRELAVKLDEIYQERAIAIILGSACLEAFINNVGFEHFANFWNRVEQLPITAKWQLFLELKGKGDTFTPDQQPYQFLIQLVNSRNSLVHFKSDYHKVKPFGKRVATRTEYHDMPRQLVRDLPARLEQLIKELCQATGIPTPTWLTPQPQLGWLS
jgi:hypothetical protein